MEPKYIGVNFPFDITFLDFPDPTSSSLLIYLIGCEHSCPDCQNLEFQQLEPGKSNRLILHTATLIRTIDQFLKDNKRVDSVVLSGGDPLFENNEYFTKKFCIEYGQKIPICVYTGYSIKEVKDMGLIGFKYLKCGKFIKRYQQESFKNDYEMHLASSNQNFYDAQYNQISEKGILKFY